MAKKKNSENTGIKSEATPTEPFSKAARTESGGLAVTSGTAPSKSAGGGASIVSGGRYDRVIITEEGKTRVIYTPKGELPESEPGYTVSPTQAKYLSSYVAQQAQKQQIKTGDVFSPESYYAATHSYETTPVKTFISGDQIVGFESPIEQKSYYAGKEKYYPKSEVSRYEKETSAYKTMQSAIEQKPKEVKGDVEYLETSFGKIRKGSVAEYAMLLPSALAAEEVEQLGKYEKMVQDIWTYDVGKKIGEDVSFAEISYINGKPILRYGGEKRISNIQIFQPFSKEPIFETKYEWTPQDIWFAQQAPKIALTYGLGEAIGASGTIVASVSPKASTVVDVGGRLLMGTYVGIEGTKVGTDIYTGIKTKSEEQYTRGLSRIGEDIVQMSSFIGGAKAGSEFAMKAGFTPYPSQAWKIGTTKVQVEPAVTPKDYYPEFEARTIYRGINVYQPSSGKSFEIAGMGSGKVAIMDIGIEIKPSLKPIRIYKREAIPKLDFSKYKGTTFSMESLASPTTKKLALASQEQWMPGEYQKFKLITNIEANIPQTPKQVYKGVEKVEAFKTEAGFQQYLKDLGSTRTFIGKPAAEQYGFVAYKPQVKVETRVSGDIDTALKKTDVFAAQFAKSESVKLKETFGEPTFWKAEEPFLIQTTQAGRSHLGDIHPMFGEVASKYAQAPESFYGLPYDIRTLKIGGQRWKTLEFGARGKAASIATLRISQEGKLYIAPEAHRMKDVADYFTLKTEQIQRAGKSSDMLKELKGKYPESLFVEPIKEFKSPRPKPSKIKIYSFIPSIAGTSKTYSKSVSQSLSSSLSQVSKSLSKSVSISPSVSVSPSISPSSLYSLSISPSLSKSVSRSLSRSVSPSRSVSRSMSASFSPSVSPSISPSRSVSPSFSISPKIKEEPIKIPSIKLDVFRPIIRKGKKAGAEFKGMKLPTLDVSFGLVKDVKYPEFVTGLEVRGYATKKRRKKK